MDDLRLLREYEPIIHFTQGELFFPCAVEDYVAQCNLWLRPPQGKPQRLVPVGELTLDKLAEYETVPPDHTLFMRFVQEPLDGVTYQRWRRRKDRPRFHAPGRLARVGLVARIADSAFDLTLLVRGKVPGGTAAAAEVQYRQMPPRYIYYGRVVREGGYIILHYLYFYTMNNWRSGFFGVNDHEADWEQVLVYLEDNGEAPPTPAWVAYAAHDYSGDDLRRRWDDHTDLTLVGNHPVVYAGAGSHASYFMAGEYLANVELKFLEPLNRATSVFQTIWTKLLGQSVHTNMASHQQGIFSLPFIDYARGDGLKIGPNQDVEWTPILISDKQGWVDDYRGLWGLDSRDPLKGENAPSGPKYNRDGTVRQSWHNPLGWAGLHKVPPTRVSVPVLYRTMIDMQEELDATKEKIEHKRIALAELELKLQALQQSEHLAPLSIAQQERLQETEADINKLYKRQAELIDTLKASQRYVEDLQAGRRSDPQSHITHKHLPQTETDIQSNRIIEAWAALSIGLVLIGAALVVIADPERWIPSLAFLGGTLVVIEALFRKRLHLLLLNVTLVLAIITAGVLVYEFFWQLLALGMIGIALMIISSNFRELQGR
ncbi:MAG: hypothetical protein H6673_11210 [Anaerolineales bacterium]|nr:hypothetical protein [Anaerolineales bacterium]